MTPSYTAAPIVAGQLVSGPGEYGGVALHVTGALAATVRLWDGTAASGTILEVIELSAAGANSWASFVMAQPVRFVKGLFVEIVAGAVEGSIRLS